MFSQTEILSVLEMLRNENLDLRTVTLGLSLLDCASDDLKRFNTKIYDRITRSAHRLVAICDAVGEKYGIPVVNTGGKSIEETAVQVTQLVGISKSSWR